MCLNNELWQKGYFLRDLKGLNTKTCQYLHKASFANIKNRIPLFVLSFDICGWFPLLLCPRATGQTASKETNLTINATEITSNKKKSKGTDIKAVHTYCSAFWSLLWLLFTSKCEHLWACVYLCEVGTLPIVAVISCFQRLNVPLGECYLVHWLILSPLAQCRLVSFYQLVQSGAPNVHLMNWQSCVCMCVCGSGRAKPLRF